MSQMARLRILHVNKFYPPCVGGIERVVRDIVEHLSPEFKMRVLVCAHNRHDPSDDVVVRARTLGIAFSMPLSIDFLRKFRTMVRQADLVHIHSPFPMGELAAVLDGCRGRRVVVSYHSDVVRQRWALPVYAPVIRALLKRADGVHVSSARIIRSSRLLSGFRSKCFLVPYGVWRDGRPSRANALPPTVREPFVLFVGRLVAYKGVEYLIDAMRHLDIPLVIVGEGPLRSALKRRAKEIGAASRIHFVGTLPPDQLNACFQRCRLLVLPSVENSEAFGLVQLEAMAFGKPVINTDLPTAVPEISLHGRTGITVPPRSPEAIAEAIRAILEDPRRYAEYARQAADRAREFSMTRFLDGIRRIYHELLCGPVPPRSTGDQVPRRETATHRV